MSELKAALIGAIVGGVISTGATWMQGKMARDKDLSAEKRQKLEMLMENASKLNHCMWQKANAPETEEDCSKDGTPFRLAALSTLYFPELQEEIMAYTRKYFDVQKKIVSCPRSKDSPEAEIRRLECIQSIFKAPTGGEEFGALGVKIEAVAQTLR